MNNTYIQILTTLVRAGIVWLTGMLLSHLSPSAWTLVDKIITQFGGTEALVVAVVGFVSTVGWGVWTRLQNKVNLDTALQLPKGATVAEVKEAAPNPLTALTDPQPK